MKIIFVSARAPFGRGESFVLEELEEVRSQGGTILLVPCRGTGAIFHEKAEPLLKNTLGIPLFSAGIFLFFMRSIIFDKKARTVLGSIFRDSRNFRIRLKNLALLPKGVYLARILRDRGFEHVHAAWGSTPATLAYILSIRLNIPWSMTLHRWEIRENNMLARKTETAAFVRCISEHGKKEMLAIIGRGSESKIKVSHLGVRIPTRTPGRTRTTEMATIVTPANLLEVKGHAYLIEAVSRLVQEGRSSFKAIFLGEGCLRPKLEALISQKRLEDVIQMPGAVPHDRLIEMYLRQSVDIVVLPSINASQGEHEGIPVALMEAMAYGIPVVATKTGGVPELLAENAGLLVEEKNPSALAEAVQRLLSDPDLRSRIGEAGKQRIRREFDITQTTRVLLDLVKAA